MPRPDRSIDRGGGGKTRPKDGLRQLFGRVSTRLGLGEHVGHLLQVHAAAIVFHFHDQASSLRVQTQDQRTHRRFSFARRAPRAFQCRG